MKLIDRAFQRALLTQLADAYPDFVSGDPLRLNGEDEALTSNGVYLHEHGLIEAKFRQAIGVPHSVVMAKITAKGIDFLADDGGLSAILGVVTVKFDESTLKALIAARIDSSDAPAETKLTLKKQLADLGASSVKHLTEKLLDKGLTELPNAWRLIEAALSAIST